MKKAIRHIILLCILLLSGNSPLFAQTLTAPLLATSVIKKIPLDKPTRIASEHLFGNQFNLANPVKDLYSKKEIVVDNEEEDSEIISYKKLLNKSVSCSSFFRQQIAESTVSYLKKASDFPKNLFYFPLRNPLYIIFEVFRI
ncbi:hypothetical protein ABS764_04595 [Flavobacterium sp. ST-87]|uniref:Uncharacterized protein n=1 Tax=Flavobacterium plantiphilum TaxID=3163297 RepID=A0ABW8XQT6_9FLAO